LTAEENKVFKQTLFRWKTLHEMTLVGVGREINIKPPTMYSWARGITPSSASLKTISDAFGIPVS